MEGLRLSDDEKVVPPRAYKGRSRVSDQQKRRELALERQKAARRDLQAHARRLVQVTSTTTSDGLQPPSSLREAEMLYEETESRFPDAPVVTDSAETRGLFMEGIAASSQQARSWYAKQLMQPEWMVDIPPDLSQDWYVLPRPEGKRCLVVSTNGSTVSRLRSGHILHRFPSLLPNGAKVKGVAGPEHVFCILDCIFHEPDQTYYVVDLMCWKGYSFYDCAAEFRIFWVGSKLEEVDASQEPSTYHRYRFCPVPVYQCNAEGLQRAYAGEVPYQKDGLLLYNKHAHYTLGLTPLALLWKDQLTSRYLIDTDSEGNIPPYQQVVLELRADRTVATSDDPPVVLGTMPESFLNQHEKRLRPGTLLKFTIRDAGLQIVDGKPVAADIRYEGLANQKRGGPDSCTKILFQYAARHDPLVFDELLAAVQSSLGVSRAVPIIGPEVSFAEMELTLAQ